MRPWKSRSVTEHLSQECGISVAGQQPNNGVVFPLGFVLRTRCWAKLVFSFRSVPRFLPKLIILCEPYYIYCLVEFGLWSVVTEPLPPERVYRAVAMGTCLPSWLFPGCDPDGVCLYLSLPRLLTFLEMESLIWRGELCLSFSGKLVTARYLCIKFLLAFPSRVTLYFGPRQTHDQYFLSLTTLMAHVRLHSLYNFASDHIGIGFPAG
jgi:hypothetical protein